MNALSPFWIYTPAAVAFDYENPQPEMIDRRALAWALSLEGRWANNVQFPFSVAQHSIIVASAIRQPQYRVYGLLHDAAEAFTRDLPTDFKAWLCAKGADVLGLEHRILKAVWAHFDLQPPSAECAAAVDEADARALASEYRDVVKGKGPLWEPKAKPLPQPVKFRRQDQVEADFLERLESYLMTTIAWQRRTVE